MTALLLPRLPRRSPFMRLAGNAAALACAAALSACGVPGTVAPPTEAAPPTSAGSAGIAAQAAQAEPAAGTRATRARFADNPIVYFLIIDRFANGDPSNDHAYGRQREATPLEDVGTFHGGDLQGLTAKLKAGWFDALGVNALWITAPYEQIHGWVVGGQKAFKHYGYHGYFALDYTVVDANLGTRDDLREMIDAAHARGIRVLFDVVMNHPGYLDIVTADQLKIPVLWPGAVERMTLQNYHRNLDYNSFEFSQWWGRPWVRAGLPGYLDGGTDELTKQLAFLPDFRTESREPVSLPPFLRAKADTRARDLPDTTVRGYLIDWLTAWVRDYGVDGFRCDTVRHVEPAAWAELKVQATRALAQWKAAHPERAIDDAPFWMVGEYWGQGPERSALHDAGFDALINFEFQGLAAQYAAPDGLFERYAALQAGRPAQMLNYVSSHDTRLHPRSTLIEAGTALLLAPGGVQIYYGDETARPEGPVPAGDPEQSTRSDMNWDRADPAVLAHWQRLGRFRAAHVAVARGAHARLQDTPYAFSRVDAASGDRVVVALRPSAGARVSVGPLFPDGSVLNDAYGGHRLVVSGGAVTVPETAPALLLERAAP